MLEQIMKNGKIFQILWIELLKEPMLAIKDLEISQKN